MYMSTFTVLDISKKLCFNVRDESPVMVYMKKVMLTMMNDLYCYTYTKNNNQQISVVFYIPKINMTSNVKPNKAKAWIRPNRSAPNRPNPPEIRPNPL